jgi:hypothetical protein
MVLWPVRGFQDVALDSSIIFASPSNQISTFRDRALLDFSSSTSLDHNQLIHSNQSPNNATHLAPRAHPHTQPPNHGLPSTHSPIPLSSPPLTLFPPPRTAPAPNSAAEA